MYAAVLGQQAKDNRSSAPAKKFIEKVEMLGGNPLNDAIGTMKKMRFNWWRQLEQANDLSQKFAGSDNLRSNRYKEQASSYEQIVNMLDNRLNIYSKDGHGVADMIARGKKNLAPAKVGRLFVDPLNRSFGEDYPQYFDDYQKMRKDFQLDGSAGEDQLSEQGMEVADFEKAISLNDPERLKLFADIQGTDDGPMRSKFYEDFIKKGPKGRANDLARIGARYHENPFIKFFKDLGFGPENFDSSEWMSSLGATDPALGFMFHELTRSGNKNTKAVTEIIAGKIKQAGLVFNEISPASQWLSGATVNLPVSGQGDVSDGNQVETFEAIDKEKIDLLIKQLSGAQRKSFREALTKGGGDVTNIPVIDQYLSGISGEKDLHPYPHYWGYQLSQNNGLGVDHYIKSLLGKTGDVENDKDWAEKYGQAKALSQYINPTYFGASALSKNLKPEVQALGNGTDGMGNYPFDNLLKDLGIDTGLEPSDVTATMAASTIIKEQKRGRNSEIDTFLANKTHPIPEIGVGVRYHDDLVKYFYENYGSLDIEKATAAGMGSYAPFGYPEKWGSTKPLGAVNGIQGFLGALNKGLTGKPEAKARGFVPNFSKVAGEIAASRSAGYKTPVRPSQVKSMSIPGVGKTSYNTQESVFKAKGMTQPFIRPPADSKAAKPYAKKVQSKFNFNPYGKRAADGFVPNFAPGADSSGLGEATKRFSDSVGLFERFGSSLKEAFDGIDFSQLASASNSILEASKEFTNQSKNIKDAAQSIAEANTTNNPNVNIDFTDINNAASTISESFNQLSRQLSSPVVLDSSNFETAAGNLQNISITVTVPDVQVNVQGAGAAANQIKDAVGKEVQTKIQDSLSNTNFASKEEINRSLGTNL
jgi:hypothetical protein